MLPLTLRITVVVDAGTSDATIPAIRMKVQTTCNKQRVSYVNHGVLSEEQRVRSDKGENVLSTEHLEGQVDHCEAEEELDELDVVGDGPGPHHRRLGEPRHLVEEGAEAAGEGECALHNESAEGGVREVLAAVVGEGEEGVDVKDVVYNVVLKLCV